MSRTNQLELVLRSLKRPVKVVSYSTSPQFHRVQVRPLHRQLANGGRGAMTQAKHLRGMEEDIALGLGIEHVEATVLDGKLWLHIPRDKRGFVRMRHVGHNGYSVPWVLGKTIENEDLVLDLASPASPHILIAGTTGSGKTVGMKAGIAYLIKHGPEVCHIIVDVKNDLAVFDGLENVKYTNDPELAFQWMCKGREIAERRFARGVRDDDETLIFSIDELADLVYQFPDIEDILVKLGQKVRSAKMHLVLATQRPTVDVVTGLIKANMPVRVAYQVVSKVDSRVIIDQNGAERLLGRGDGLLMMNGRTTRFQGVYVEDREIR